MSVVPAVPKLTIIFPGGDLTTVLISKEKDTILRDLIEHHCLLRGLEVKHLKILNDVGKGIDVSQTVGASGLVFVELIEKHSKEEDQKVDTSFVIHFKGRPEHIGIKVGEICRYSLKEQLFPEEWKAIHDYRHEHENLAKNYSDEFVIACLFSKKFDFKRTAELMEKNLKWRRMNGFMNIPKFEEISGIVEKMKINFQIPGCRDKEGSGIQYGILGAIEMGKEPFTVTTMKKWMAWYNYVGIFHDGLDFHRNGIVLVEDLSGYGWKHVDIDYQRHISSAFIDTFPLRVKQILVLNPPMIFGALYKIFKTFFKAKIIERVIVVEDMNEMEKFFHSEQLATHFGGTCSFNLSDWHKRLEEFCNDHEERLIAPGREN